MNLDLTWRLLKGGGRRGLLGAWLTLGAVAVSTALLLFAVAVNFAFAARADRGAWRNPVPAEAGAVAIEAARFDFVGDQVITVVDLAALDARAAAGARPPGMPRLPAPGEVWLSPALAELARKLPADQLAERYPDPAGVLGDEALVYPGELVAVVGHAPDAPAMTAAGTRDGALGKGPAKVADLTGTPSEDSEAYRALTLVASVLMVVPLLVFGGAAARLTVARRDWRLAALRLVGATPGQVVRMTVAEAVIVALAGALLGAAAYAAAAPLLAGIPIAGGSWFVSDVLPGPLPLAAVLAGVPLLVGLSAVVGLRRVVVSPLGVAKRETPPAMRFVRVLALFAVLAAFPLLTRGTSIGIVAVALGLAFLCVNLAGPWVVSLIGRITAGSARRPAGLLAGRRLVDDPRSAWRTVSGVALTGFVAGFIGLLSPSAFAGDGEPPQLLVSAPAGQAEAVAGQARDRLRAAGVRATVRVSRRGTGDALVATALGSYADPATIDRARTALTGLMPGRTPTTRADDERFATQLLADIRMGTTVVLSVSFLVAIASAGITAASSILDRRQTYALLRLAGTPLEVLDRARRAETLVPLTVMGGGAILVGVFCAMPFMIGGMSVAGAITLGACVVVGFGGVVGAGALSRPLLRSVTADPAPRPD
ncbi:FtsX-like permease family protein [Nonomuraea jiangxiensis]|uniref:FtsX-like permease family protein n=1 Tax=Nonomuraea jiangxiensis TaxID=633440 RepID=A0A1G9FX79_9ACTN|nr:FtsX-like permease family protein [Nonomuraea jiangxiensis]SDK93041.1 FtsX-like permease family protein [Nonomuraea jiangxiensis]